MADNPALMKKVSELDVSTRVNTCFAYHNIVYIGDLVQWTDRELWVYTPNFGPKSLAEVKEMLADMGLHLGMQLEGWSPQDSCDPQTI